MTLARRAGWSGFAAAASVLFGLAIVGGQFGDPGAAAPLVLPGGLRIPAGSFIAVYFLTWLACAAVFLALPRGIPFRQAGIAIFAVAVAARLAVLPLAASDDVNRYLWEGRLLAHGWSPYHHPPIGDELEDAALSRLRSPADEIWRGINHPEMTAIYPPLALAGFAAIARVWYDPLAIKVVMAAFDLTAVLLLLRILRRRQGEAHWAIWYALNPLTLYSFAGRGHLDAVQVALVLGAILQLERRRWAPMFFLLGAAIQVKYIAVLALPFFLRRENLRFAPLAAVVAVLPFVPFVAIDPGGVFASLLRFGHEMAFNGFLHGWLRLLLGDIDWATRLSALVFLAAIGIGSATWLRLPAGCRVPSAGALFALGTFLACAPTVHSWYLATPLALVTLHPSPLWIVASATIAFSHVAGGVAFETGAFALPAWGQVASWLVPTLLLARVLRRRWWPCYPPPRTVAVLIPAREEGDCIAASVAAATADACVVEVIVIDAGSRDDTVARATAAGARVLSAPPSAWGRGGQVDYGLRRARGDLVAIVHADVVLRPGALDAARRRFALQPDVIGGALGSEFERGGWRLGLLGAANRARAALFGVSFGDQVQCFRRRPLVESGLYPAIPLMEDIELSLRLQRLGRRDFFWQRNRVSSRRWRSRQTRRAARILGLIALYLARRAIGRGNAADLHRRYYGDAGSSPAGGAVFRAAHLIGAPPATTEIASSPVASDGCDCGRRPAASTAPRRGGPGRRRDSRSPRSPPPVPGGRRA